MHTRVVLAQVHTHDTLKLGTCKCYKRETRTRDTNTSTRDTCAREIRSYVTCTSDTQTSNIRSRDLRDTCTWNTHT